MGDAVPPKRPGPKPDPTYENLVELFLESGADVEEIDWRAMDRRWSTVAQGLRVALKKLGHTGLAFVSVNEGEQRIHLRRRPRK